MGTDPIWLTEARKYLGVKEIKGQFHEPLILKWRKLIHSPFMDDEQAWCSTFVGGCFEAVGIRSTRSDAARSWMKWGVEVEPCLGCVVVFWRESPQSWKGHVAFLVGKDKKGNLMCLGGNQGDMVKVSSFATNRVLGYRFPVGVIADNHPLPILTSSGELSQNEA